MANLNPKSKYAITNKNPIRIPITNKRNIK